MFKSVNKDLWAFDVEWVPDPEAGRRLYQLPEDTPDTEVIQKMWEEGGADEETLMPYLKTTICRVISIAAVVRSEKGNGEVALSLTALLLEKDPCRQADVPLRCLRIRKCGQGLRTHSEGYRRSHPL